jgi:hypothetical protein
MAKHEKVNCPTCGCILNAANVNRHVKERCPATGPHPSRRPKRSPLAGPRLAAKDRAPQVLSFEQLKVEISKQYLYRY